MEAIAGPFLGTEAVASGLVSRRQLSCRYEAIYRNVYKPRGEQLTASSRAKAAWLWSGRDATLAGLSSAAMHGSLWIDPSRPAELVRRGDEVSGIVIHRDVLVEDEICVIDGMAATTPARTGYDLGRRDTLTRSVIRLDALARATGLCRRDVDLLVDRHRGARGIVQLRRALELMDGGAESPQEHAHDWCLFGKVYLRRRPRSSLSMSSGTRSHGSTWAGRSGKSASSTTVPNTG